jgi:spermidine/putrescine-binding protein
MRIPIAAAMAGAVCLGSAFAAWAQTAVGTWQGVYTPAEVEREMNAFMDGLPK